LLITVVIVGILATVAYPSFMDQIRKGRRSDAMDLAAQVMQAQERYRGNSPVYSVAPTTQLGFSSTTSAGGYYTMAIAAPGGDASKLNGSYVLTLTAVSGKSQASDTGCTSLTVTVSNGSPTYAPATCWSR
jgi:type IV pilus assembly protein PilE